EDDKRWVEDKLRIAEDRLKLYGLLEAHNARPSVCGIVTVKERQAVVIECVEEFRDEIKELASKVDHLEARQEMAIEQRTGLGVKLDRYASKVDQVLGALSDKRGK